MKMKEFKGFTFVEGGVCVLEDGSFGVLAVGEGGADA